MLAVAVFAVSFSSADGEDVPLLSHRAAYLHEALRELAVARAEETLRVLILLGTVHSTCVYIVLEAPRTRQVNSGQRDLRLNRFHHECDHEHREHEAPVPRHRWHHGEVSATSTQKYTRT